MSSVLVASFALLACLFKTKKKRTRTAGSIVNVRRWWWWYFFARSRFRVSHVCMSIVLHNHDGSVDRSFIYLRTSTYAFDVMIWTKAEIETETVFCLNWRKKKSKNIAKSRTNFVVDIRRPSYWVRGVVTFIFINRVQNVLKNNSIKKFEEIYNRFFSKSLKIEFV